VCLSPFNFQELLLSSTACSHFPKLPFHSTKSFPSQLTILLASLAQTEIEVGNGLPEIRLTRKCLEALKQAGFEVTASFSFFFFFKSLFIIGTSFNFLIYFAQRSYGRKILLRTHKSLGTLIWIQVASH
jgi:hypothetical protein